jgi:isopentenyl-diphosphate delta-isomerase
VANPAKAKRQTLTAQDIPVTDIMIPAWVDGTLQPMEKLAAHQQGVRHMAVSVFAVAAGKVLIQQRALGKYHTPGLWANTCCTHPEWNEDMTDCALRRLDQELGIKGVAPVHRGQVEYRADVGGGLIEHEVVEVFLAETTLGLPLDLNPDEVMDARWVDYDDLIAQVAQAPSRFTPWLSIYLAEHSDLIFGGTQAG